MTTKLSVQEMNRLSIDEFHEAEKLPLIVVLDDVRSLYNVGSVFRTSDAFRVEAVYLCGITAIPGPVDMDGFPTTDAKAAAEGSLRDCTLKASQEIHKTALGAEDSVAWRYFKDYNDAIAQLHRDGYTVLAVEQCHGSTMLSDFHPWQDALPAFQSPDNGGIEMGTKTIDKGRGRGSYAVILGNEVKGVHQDLIDQCDGCLEIPQYGTKHSLNVSVTGGIIIWHFSSAYNEIKL